MSSYTAIMSSVNSSGWLVVKRIRSMPSMVATKRSNSAKEQMPPS
ncbi:Uncharacterised protein [Vibrio cholerae]|nr:Uncharacterised protein [Vibrio cholerae]